MWCMEIMGCSYQDGLDLEAGTAAVTDASTSSVADVWSCLSEADAVAAAEAVGQMSDADLSLETMEEI